MERVKELCKRVQTLLGFPEADDARRRGGVDLPGGEGLRLLALRAPAEKVDPGARGLHDCVCAGGLDTCTENLGSESCDGGIDAEAESLGLGMGAECGERKTRKEQRRRERANFPPPPLRWLSGSEGWGCRFMRAERRDGRLILTAVRIERPDVFRARREGGRLRLHMIETEGEGGAEESRGGRWGEEGFLRCHETRVGGGTAGVSSWNPPFLLRRDAMKCSV